MSKITMFPSERNNSIAYAIISHFTLGDFKRLGFESAKKVIVVGPLDSGKTSLCKKIMFFYFSRKLEPLRFFDLDVGQSSIGPPGTIGTAYINSRNDLANLRRLPIAELSFIGSLYPYGSEPKIYKSIKTILRFIPKQSRIIIDTTGFRKADKNVKAFKCKKIEIISPDMVVALSASPLEDAEFLNAIMKTTRKVDGKFYLFPLQNNFTFKSKIVRSAHHDNALKYWLDDGYEIKLPTKLLGPDGIQKVSKHGYNWIVGLIDERDLCVGGGVFTNYQDNYITIYGKIIKDARIVSVDIGAMKVDLRSQKIIPDHA